MYTLFPPVAIIALAVFMGIQNRNAAVRQLFVDACNEIISTSPFTDISVTDLRNACAQENLYGLGRSVIWTAARSALQVRPNPTFINSRCCFPVLLDYGRFGASSSWVTRRKDLKIHLATLKVSLSQSMRHQWEKPSMTMMLKRVHLLIDPMKRQVIRLRHIRLRLIARVLEMDITFSLL